MVHDALDVVKEFPPARVNSHLIAEAVASGAVLFVKACAER
jgi:hypothetical protein